MTSSGPHFNYDEVPYPDYSFLETHPDHLAMLGQLLGMTPASVANCRVLELGCGTGRNLLAMASSIPAGTFVGVDLSGVQIQKATEVAVAAELHHVTFKQMDILDIQPDFGEFDYIIAHGVFSWVPPFVREKVLDICKHNLAAQGIAYISYNTYPGWHRMEMIRNMMLYRTRSAHSPQEKTQQASEWIEFMAKALSEKPESAYSAVFSSYLAQQTLRRENGADAAFLHDELEANNQPFYFHQFIDLAQQHGLQYLVESDFSSVIPSGFSADVIDQLKKAAPTAIELEQYLDFLNDRTFRCTLLCHDTVKIERRVSIMPLKHFWLSSNAVSREVDAEKAAQGVETFSGSDNAQFSTNHPLTKAAFHLLIDSNPQRIGFLDLMREANLRLNSGTVKEEDVVILATNLLRAFTYSSRLIDFHVFAPSMTFSVSERPATSALIRSQAHTGPHITNLLHERVELDNFNRLVLINLDGENDRDSLLDFLVELAEEGKLSIKKADGDDLRYTLSVEMEKSLRQFALLGLLVS